MNALPGQGSAPCAICGAARTRHEAVSGPTCASLACRTRIAIQRREEIDKADQNVFRQYVEQQDAAMRSCGDLAIRVPFMDCPVVPLPERRKAAFRQSLKKYLRRAFQAIGTDESVSDDGEATGDPDAQASAPLRATCIACGGHCCRQGSTHAFLDEIYLPRLVRGRPGDSAARIYRDYLARLPRESYSESCVFHTAGGCALPRRMRAHICNSFSCARRQDAEKQLSEQQPASVFIVAIDSGVVGSAAQVTADGHMRWLRLKPIEQVEPSGGNERIEPDEQSGSTV
ncbi:MAG: hypothetical protein HKN42_09395 [Granulosicoccus sp.]|nr:hypothetical protein [Granulosicoccus sp.]